MLFVFIMMFVLCPTRSIAVPYTISGFENLGEEIIESENHYANKSLIWKLLNKNIIIRSRYIQSLVLLFKSFKQSGPMISDIKRWETL